MRHGPHDEKCRFCLPRYGLAGLGALRRAGVEIAAVFTHEDDPEEKCWFGSVKNGRSANGIPVHYPEEVNSPHWIDRIAALKPESLFSFYYRRMLKETILTLPSAGPTTFTGRFCPPTRALSRQLGARPGGNPNRRHGSTIWSPRPMRATSSVSGSYPSNDGHGRVCCIGSSAWRRGNSSTIFSPDDERNSAANPAGHPAGKLFRGPETGRRSHRLALVRREDLQHDPRRHGPLPGRVFAFLPDGAKTDHLVGVPEETAGAFPEAKPGRIEVEDGRV